MRGGAERFEVRLAQDADDLAAAQRLRYRVFVEELGAQVPPEDHALRRERDPFDALTRHLLLIDRECAAEDPLDHVVGVYRLMDDRAAREGRGFYGASEYDLTPLLASGRRLLELGRSCVAAEYRGGIATHLMWQGLADLVLAEEIEILFGVASFHGTDPEALAGPLSLLHHEFRAPEAICPKAIGPGRAEMDLCPPDQIDRHAAMLLIPALIKGYLRLGGRIGDGAYIDRNFNTIDVCLVMDTARMTARARAQYARQEGQE